MIKCCFFLLFLAIGANSECQDFGAGKRCENWKNDGHCVSKPIKMLKTCRRTCGFCECKNYVYPNSVCREKKIDGKCGEESVAVACWKACSKCKYVPLVPAGENKPETTTTTPTTTTSTTTPTTTTTSTTHKTTTTTTPTTTTTTTSPTKTTTTTPTTTTTTTTPTTTTTTTTKKATNQASYSCGKPVFHNVGKVVGGEEVVMGSLPWQASLRRSTTRRHFCGGTLLNNEWVVTAAHCVDWSTSPEDFGIFLGKHYSTGQNQKSNKHAVWRLVSYIIVHEKFDSSMLYNDIALMKLATPVEFSDYIIPICLPSSNLDLEPGQDLYVSGWGDTQGSDNDHVLRMAMVPYVANDQCESWLGTIRETEICAGREGKDSCQGDSGGPLIKVEKEQTLLVGVVSWGIGCALKNKPGVYTRVSSYVGWVNSNIRKSKIISDGMRRPGINGDMAFDENVGQISYPDGTYVKEHRENDH